MLVGVNLNGLAPGEYDGMIRLAWSSSTEVLTIPVSLNLAAATAPAISSGGVVNAATFVPNADAGGELAPGIFASIFGIRLASSAAFADQLPLPRLLNGVSVTFNGAPAPLTYVSENQVNVVVPQALSGSSAAVVVRRDGEASSTETVRLTPVRPLIFLVDGRAAALNLGDDGAALNGPETPAQPGQTITIFGTGFGPTENPLPDGVAATGENRIFGSAEVLVGGREAEVSYAGLSPGSAHLYQINAELHPETPVGCDVPLTLRIDGVEGNEAPLAVTADGSACQ